jgi:hypothetical protein
LTTSFGVLFVFAGALLAKKRDTGLHKAGGQYEWYASFEADFRLHDTGLPLLPLAFALADQK